MWHKLELIRKDLLLEMVKTGGERHPGASSEFDAMNALDERCDDNAAVMTNNNERNVGGSGGGRLTKS
jgi:hypothetical protein